MGPTTSHRTTQEAPVLVKRQKTWFPGEKWATQGKPWAGLGLDHLDNFGGLWDIGSVSSCLLSDPEVLWGRENIGLVCVLDKGGGLGKGFWIGWFVYGTCTHRQIAHYLQELAALGGAVPPPAPGTQRPMVSKHYKILKNWLITRVQIYLRKLTLISWFFLISFRMGTLFNSVHHK